MIARAQEAAGRLQTIVTIVHILSRGLIDV